MQLPGLFSLQKFYENFCIQNFWYSKQKKEFHLQKVTKFFLMAQETQVSTIDSSHRSLFDSIDFFFISF